MDSIVIKLADLQGLEDVSSSFQESWLAYKASTGNH